MIFKSGILNTLTGPCQYSRALLLGLMASILPLGRAQSASIETGSSGISRFEEVTADFLRMRLEKVNSGDAGEDFALRAELSPGLIHCVAFRSGAVPVVINSFVADLSRDDLAVDVVKASESVSGREKIEAIAQQAGGRAGWTPTAAINGGFWDSGEWPVGVCAGGGRIYAASSHRWSLLLTENGAAAIGPCQIERSISLDGGKIGLQGLNSQMPQKGAVLYTSEFGLNCPATDDSSFAARVEFQNPAEIRINSPIRAIVREISRGGGQPLAPGMGWLVFSGMGEDFDAAPWSVGSEIVVRIDTPEAKAPVSAALSAGPILALNGEACFDPLDSEFAALEGALPRARSAVGLSSGGKKMILMTIDGSRYGPSRGATLEELCREMLAMGATEVLNLDGGSSTTAWADGRVVNRPGGLVGSRPVSNALVVFRRN
jgi:hypothetical protein